ncbi:hypothetical protein [Nostoc sp.]|uniref:hypothetical protein n=1 Tax=Nostoc sp. TaxID=1180 RepID=UPI00359435ED
MSEDKKNLPVKRDSRSGFLDKVRSSKAISAAPKQKMLKRAIAHTERPRLLFAMDATASREACWNIAKEITGAMFEAVPGELDVALAYHSGGRLQEMTPFSSEARAFLDKVQAVRCSAGRTALNEILDKAAQAPRIRAIIYIGDCFEEDPTEAVELAQQLKLKGVRCFIFHDTSSQAQGYDTKAARKAFEQIAQVTGGAILPFDETSPNLVRELLSAIALYAAQGIKALQQQTKLLPAARLLLEQMK